MILYADRECPDQTAQMRRLTWAFTVRIYPKACFRMARPIYLTEIELQYVGCANVHWTELRPGTGNRCVDEKEFYASEEYFSFKQSLFNPGEFNPKDQNQYLSR